jgi:hypothetical protein
MSIMVRDEGIGDPRRKANRRLGWVLASVALVFFVGFVTKVVLFGR